MRGFGSAGRVHADKISAYVADIAGCLRGATKALSQKNCREALKWMKVASNLVGVLRCHYESAGELPDQSTGKLVEQIESVTEEVWQRVLAECS